LPFLGNEGVLLVPQVRGTFLVVVDDTPECKLALRYAARRASRTAGAVSLLYVMAPADFQHWSGVGNIMRQEAQEEAERVLDSAAAEVNLLAGIEARKILREGKTREELLKLLAEDADIRVLVLGAGTGKEGPGPLVTSLAGTAAGNLPVVLTIVPGALKPEQVDDLS